MKKSLALLLCFVASFVFAEERIVLKVASIAPSRSPWDIELKKLGEKWNKVTNGAVELKIYNMLTLGGEKAGIQKLKGSRPGRKAPLDGAVFTTIGLHELVPEAAAYTLSLPFLIQNQKELNAVLATEGKKIEAKIAADGYELVTWSNVGWISFYTKDTYNTLSELKKIKVFIPGFDSPILSDSFKVSGFTVEDIPAQKFAQSIKSKNGPRGFFATHLMTYATGFYKDISYALDLKLCPVMAAFVISESSWKQIPKKYHAAMKAAAEETRRRLNDSLDSSDDDCVRKMKAGGVKMIRPSVEELQKWDAEFSRDIENIHRAFPQAFDMQMYKDIKKLLAPMRK